MESKLPVVVQHRIDLEAKQYAFYNYVTAATPANFDDVSTWPQYAQVAYYSIKHYMLGDLTCWPYKEPTLAVEYATLKERCEKMEAKGNDLALALRRLSRSVSVHPDCYKGSEWDDYVSFAEEKLSEWEGESNTPAPGEGEKEINNDKGKTMSYTKGQWYLQKYTDAYTNIIRCNNGKHETIYIASTPQSTLPETRANAKLMAAAPDLLEALQEVVAISDRNHVAWGKAKAAIEKAIGNDIIENNNPH